MSTKQFAIIFPGQGSQAVGMLHELAARYACVQDTFSKASDLLGYDLWELTQHGPAEKLNQTELTQPALLTANYAVWLCWQAEGGDMPAIFAGHSLGEYSALLAAGVLPFADALRLVAARGRYMQDAVAVGVGAMAAIVGLDNHAIEMLCSQARQEDEVLSPANFNSIGQTVVAGHIASVKKAIELAKSHGAKLAKLIPVSVPSHCALMQSAADRLAEEIQTMHFAKPAIPVIHNVDVATHDDPAEIQQALISQLTQPVRWVETVQWLEAKNITALVECGPGNLLAGLNKRISKDVVTYATNSQTALRETIQKIKEEVVCL